MSEGMQHGVITNARFLTVGTGREVIGGTLNGRTFYSEPIEEIDGNTIKTAKGVYRYSRNHSHD